MPILGPRDEFLDAAATPDDGKMGQWLDGLIDPGTPGYLQVARGVGGYFTDSGRYEFKRRTGARSISQPHRAAVTRSNGWPSTQRTTTSIALRTSTTTRQRAKGNAARIEVAHTDVDGGLDPYDEVIDRGNGIIVASGTDDHAQVFIPLADEVTTEQHEILCRGLVKRFDGDKGKISDNDLLRPAGTINHKGRARGGASVLVDFIREPQPNARKLKARVLAAELGVDLVPNIPSTNGSPTTTSKQVADKQVPGADDPPKPVDLSRYPVVTGSARRTAPGPVHTHQPRCARVLPRRPAVGSGDTVGSEPARRSGRQTRPARTSRRRAGELAQDRGRMAAPTDPAGCTDRRDPRRRRSRQVRRSARGHHLGTHPLGPWLNGTVTVPKPTLGMARSDGLRLIYPGKEHAILGETESGKTWFALGCVAAELLAGNLVVYIHYEEGDPDSTLERLQLLGVNGPTIDKLLRFVAPSKPVKSAWVDALCTPPPVLVVHDGVNEAMALMDMEVKDIDGAATFRRKLVTPFRRVGAATIACDHMPMNAAPGRIEAFGSVHKGNALDGARIQLINETPFGRGKRGVSHVYVTKDRPGHLRIHGKSSTKTPGKTFMGTLVVDDEPVFTPFQMLFYAPKADDVTAADPESALADAVHEVITKLPGHAVGSERLLFAEMRQAGHKFTEAKVKAAVDDLIVAGRLIEVIGKNRAKTYEAVASAAASAAECGGEAI